MATGYISKSFTYVSATDFATKLKDELVSAGATLISGSSNTWTINFGTGDHYLKIYGTTYMYVRNSANDGDLVSRAPSTTIGGSGTAYLRIITSDNVFCFWVGTTLGATTSSQHFAFIQGYNSVGDSVWYLVDSVQGTSSSTYKEGSDVALSFNYSNLFSGWKASPCQVYIPADKSYQGFFNVVGGYDAYGVLVDFSMHVVYVVNTSDYLLKFNSSYYLTTLAFN